MNLSRLSPAIIVPAIAIAGTFSAPAPARGADCVLRYAECLVQAAELDTWWQRSAAGIDCYLDAVACVRSAYF